MSKQTYKECFCCQRSFKQAASRAPKEIKALFGSYSENGIMTANHLQSFLVEIQKEDKTSVEDAQALTDSFRHLHMFHRSGITVDVFFKYLFGDLNPPLSPKLGVYQDMSAPLSHYFIYTGLNSYLTGNQLTSDCSDIPIINALQKGVRVIELDLWPNSSKDNVEVRHGGAMTSPVELIKCLRSIKEHAFTASEYPVFITLEGHLTPDLQAKTTEMVTQTFGETLYLPDSEYFKAFPSPEELKKRILISTKPPEEYIGAKDVKEDSEKSRKDSGDEKAWGKEVPPLKSMEHEKHHGSEDGDADEDEDDDDISKSQKLEAPEYKRLISIHAGKPKGGLKEALNVDFDLVRCLSLSEEQLEKATVNHAKEIFSFTHRNMLRIYPKGTHINSSNYNPLVGWIHGAQMVAFNMRGYRRSHWLMQGMFRANGGCGYVKKPDILLNQGPNGEIFDPKLNHPLKKTLKVTVYIGEGWYYEFVHTHFDQFSPPDFYVRVGIAGVQADTIMKKTKTLEDNWTPAWNEEFMFPLTVPELALLRIEVHVYDMSGKDDFGGQTVLPIWEIREGIRSVPLYSRKGVKYRSVKLLMRFQFVSS